MNIDYLINKFDKAFNDGDSVALTAEQSRVIADLLRKLLRYRTHLEISIKYLQDIKKDIE